MSNIASLTSPISRKQRRSTESITFRLDSKILNKLRLEANQNEVSLNTLVSQIIKRHEDWHSNASKAGFIAVRRAFLTLLMDKIPDQEISSLSKYIARKETKDFVMLLRNQYSIESALNVAESWVRISGYPFRHENSDDIHTFVIQHDMGRKMSLYLTSFYTNLFDDFGLSKVRFDQSDNTISFVVDMSPTR